MSGSLQKFIYTDDQARTRIVNLDESNTRALGYIPATNLEVDALGIPRKISKLTGGERYILLTGVTTGGKPVRRKVIVPTNNNTFFLDGGGFNLNAEVGNALETIAMQVTAAVGEKKRFALLGTDTGLDDGTQP